MYPKLFPGKLPLTVSAASYNALLAVYAVSKVLDERGEELLDGMSAGGLVYDSYTYTALMMGRGDRQEVRAAYVLTTAISITVFVCSYAPHSYSSFPLAYLSSCLPLSLIDPHASSFYIPYLPISPDTHIHYHLLHR